MGNAAHQIQVVADQQQRHAQAFLQFLEQQQDLALHRDVERGGWLVGNQQLRLVGQGHGNHHPLALTAGELVRLGFEAFVWLLNTDQFQQLQGALVAALPLNPLCTSTSRLCFSMVCSGLSEVIGSWKIMAIRLPRIGRRRFSLKRQQIMPGVANAARGMAGQRVGQQVQDRMGGHRFARTAFTDQRQGFAAANVEIQPSTTRGCRRRRRTPRRDRGFRSDGPCSSHFLGSKASRADSPMNTSKLSISANTRRR